MLYQAYQSQRDFTAPVRALAGLANWSLGELPTEWTDNRLVRRMSAGYEMIERSPLTHERPPFGIEQVTVAGEMTPVREEVVMSTPFSSLLHFAKDDSVSPSPVSCWWPPWPGTSPPCSGRPCGRCCPITMCTSPTGTTRVTSGIEHGDFGLDDYIAQVIADLEYIGPGVHLLSVCQPCPAALAATALMAADDNPAQPRTLTLMAGPVDTRVNPDEGERSGPFEATQLVRAQRHHHGAPALSGGVAARLPGLPPGERVREHESGAPHPPAREPLQRISSGGRTPRPRSSPTSTTSTSPCSTSRPSSTSRRSTGSFSANCWPTGS